LSWNRNGEMAAKPDATSPAQPAAGPVGAWFTRPAPVGVIGSSLPGQGQTRTVARDGSTCQTASDPHLSGSLNSSPSASRLIGSQSAMNTFCSSCPLTENIVSISGKSAAYQTRLLRVTVSAQSLTRPLLQSLPLRWPKAMLTGSASPGSPIGPANLAWSAVRIPEFLFLVATLTAESAASDFASTTHQREQESIGGSLAEAAHRAVAYRPGGQPRLPKHGLEFARARSKPQSSRNIRDCRASRHPDARTWPAPKWLSGSDCSSPNSYFSQSTPTVFGTGTLAAPSIELATPFAGCLTRFRSRCFHGAK